MQRLLAEGSAQHFPNPPATADQIAAFEARVGWELDPELRAFYLHCDGDTLTPREMEPNYRILSRAEIGRARVKPRREDNDRYGAATGYTLIYLQDSDYGLVNVAPGKSSRYPSRDAFHETTQGEDYRRVRQRVPGEGAGKRRRVFLAGGVGNPSRAS